MSRRIGGHIRSNIIGYLALFLSLTLGTAWALEKNSVGSKQLKPNAVKNSDLAANAVTGPKVADGSLGNEDFGGGELPAGQRGATGAQGPQGPQGAIGPAGATGPAGADGQNGSPDTAAQILAKLLTVDDNNSGLNADSLDGLQGSGFVQDTDISSCSPSSDIVGAFGSQGLCANSVSGFELSQTSFFESDRAALNDLTIGFGGAGQELFSSPSYVVTAKCEQVAGGVYQASITVDSLGGVTTFSVDSDASNGADAVNQTTEQDLIVVGPTGAANFETGDFAVIGFDGGGASAPPLFGSVSAGVALGDHNCHLAATGWSPN